jgi:hypothetical protein
MARAKRFFSDRQRPLEEIFRLPILALVSIQVRQVVQALAHLGVVRTERFFLDDQGAFEEPFRVAVFALRSIHER